MAADTPHIVAHIDLNSFFASVEQQANPFLRGRPLGVCAYLHKNGCIIAASIEAKQRGMKVGMTVDQATQKVPDAIFIQNDPPKYRAVTSRVFSIFDEISDSVEHYSIDEAFLDLTGWYRDPAEAAWALARVRTRIREEVGEWLGCSIGIAPTRFLAKLGSDIQKPQGLTVITHENLDEILASLDLEDVCGVGPRMRRRLEKLGYHSLLEVKHAPVENLIRSFGKYGYSLWSKLHGVEIEKVVSDEPLPKSIGHSYCVPNRVNRDKTVEPVLAKLTERAARRLRAHGLFAGAVVVDVGFRSQGPVSPTGSFRRLLQGEGAHSTIPLSEPADDSFTLVGAATSLLRELWHGEPVSFLGVTLVELSVETQQLCMPIQTHAPTTPTRLKRLSDAADAVRDRHGDHALILGRLFRAGDDEAPDRIGFRKTTGVDVARAWDGIG